MGEGGCESLLIARVGWDEMRGLGIALLGRAGCEFGECLDWVFFEYWCVPRGIVHWTCGVLG